MRRKPRIAVFASGSGSNFEAIAEAIQSGELGADIPVLITDKPLAPVITRAERLGIPAAAVNPKAFPDKAAFERTVLARLRDEEIDWIVLAGYMRLIGPTLLGAFPNRIVNIHPSLLPAFPGKDAVGQALAAGVETTGVTVHFVDEGMDTGPVILQREVPVVPGDREKTEAAIHAIEHELYKEALQKLLAEEQSRV
ncbi:phosphoribosylglycinamide formyltransferase [Bhargavaea ullalensis]|uniref:Phosphoribosylglycinamide formyltransferase n=1 Tax=Bhargavaea ullalensis TaxID=1265685 RepID=A0ABV2GBA4_9BACL